MDELVAYSYLLMPIYVCYIERVIKERGARTWWIQLTNCSDNCLGTVKAWWHHQMETFSALLAICAGNSPDSPHKGQWRVALMFSLICVWINGWVNNREAGDLRLYHAHYDATVMGRDKGGTEHKMRLPPCPDNFIATIIWHRDGIIELLSMSLTNKILGQLNAIKQYGVQCLSGIYHILYFAPSNFLANVSVKLIWRLVNVFELYAYVLYVGCTHIHIHGNN